MYLLPFEQKNIVAVGNILPQNEFLAVHRIEVSSSVPVKVEVLAARNVMGGEEITSQVASSNAGSVIYRGIFKAIANPQTMELKSLMKMKTVNGDVVLVDEKDGIVFLPGTYIVVRITGVASVVGNILWNQPESRRMV